MFESLSKRLSQVFAGLAGRGKLSEANMDEGLGEIRAALLEADVHFRVAKDLVERVRDKALGTKVLESITAGQMLVKLFHDELVAMMTDEGEPIAFASGRPTVVLMAGLQGSGKTTTTAKLAVHLRDSRRRKPLLVAADVQRPAAVDQLRQLGAANDLPVFHVPGTPPEMLARLAVDEARRTGRDTVLVDTAGRLHIDAELMSELERIRGSVTPDTTFLVCDAMTGQDAVRSAKAFGETLPLDGVILTKLDGDSRGGAALSVRHVTGAPVRYVGVGEKVADLQVFHADRLVGRVLGMGDVVSLVEKAQTVVDERDAEQQMKRMLDDRFTLEDFLKQLRAIRKMGSLRDLLGHLPGVPAGADLSQIDDKMIDHTEAVVLSMTPQERRRPEVVDASRKRRIARGCGLSIDVVSRMLKQFEQMRKMMKQLKKGGLFGRLKDKFLGGGGGGDEAEAALPSMPPFAGMGVEPRRVSSVSSEDRRKNRKAERQRKKQSRRRR
ncbi:MAG: signal recognition particle protein [Planctomycetes bacterium]|nr:signal recognition particle protein [Planctomycetota bacterium]